MMISLNIIKIIRTKSVCKVLAVTAFVAPCALYVGLAHAEPLVTLKQMVEKIISSNPEVQVKYHAYVGAGYEQDVVKGGFLPKAGRSVNLSQSRKYG